MTTKPRGLPCKILSMPAYIIVEIEVLDRERYETYRPFAIKSIAQYGGRYLVRGGASETLEGTWSPKRLVVLEFPSSEQAKTWYNSPEYGEGRAIRHETSRSQMILVEGIAEGT